MFPTDLKYTAEHEWVRVITDQPQTVRVGITDFAQDALGDIVFVDLPAIGDQLESGAVVGELESTKSVSEIYTPFGGSVVAVNEALDAAPELVNSDPYGEGWLYEISTDGNAVPLLDAAAYEALIQE